MDRRIPDPAFAPTVAAARPIFELYPEIAVAWLFGSAARGEARPDSDWDVGVVFRKRGVDPLRYDRRLRELAGRLESLAPGRRIDLVTLEAQGPIFVHRVLQEGRLLYVGDEERRVDFESTAIVRALDFRHAYEVATRGRVEAIRARLREIPR